MQIEFSNIELLYCLLFIPFLGVAWTTITDQDMILYHYWKFLERIGNKSKILYYISKPLGFCTVCFTGQFAFWFYFVFDYSPVKHLFFVMLSIAVISLLNYIISWLSKT